jgi:hypothetical protein
MTDGGGNDATNDVANDTGHPMDASGDSMQGSDGNKGMDSSSDVATKEDGGDATTTTEDGGDGSTTPVTICQLLDDAYACGGNAHICGADAAGCFCVNTAPDSGSAAADQSTQRQYSWANDLQDNMIVDLYNDCRTQNLLPTVLCDADGGTAWTASIERFASQLFGCPFSDIDASTLVYGLLPPEPEQACTPWTAADVQAITENFILAVEQTLAGSGDAQTTGQPGLIMHVAWPAPNTAPGGGKYGLTTAQVAQIQSQLATLAAAIPGLIAYDAGGTAYNFNVPTDGGTCCQAADGGWCTL